MTGTDEESLDDLPPSAKLVFKVLEYNGSMTQKGIVEESMLSARTVRYALERLEGIGVVDEDVYFADARQNLYQLTGEEGAELTAQADGGLPQENCEESADTCHAGCD
ncbi:MAG: ArsR family transcriptional regulator [Haloferacaceae archaeon]